VIVLVHGSGPQDRDSTLGPNKPLRDLAWDLAARGIAVLRYEKRTKEHAGRTALLQNFTVHEETVEDAVLAVRALRGHARIDGANIFVLGHSLGGNAAPRIAKEDSGIAGLIVLAGNTRPLQELILEQAAYLASLAPDPESQQAGIEALRKMMARTLDPALRLDTPPGELMGIPATYWKDLNAYNPVAMAALLDVPMLILQGERDYQVTMEDFRGWQGGLRGRTNVTLKSYPDLNHLFMTGTGKATPAEYGRAGSVAEAVVDDIAGWLRRVQR
jgi:alpha-beta hydrolase superfamily lysophospholipase